MMEQRSQSFYFGLKKIFNKKNVQKSALPKKLYDLEKK